MNSDEIILEALAEGGSITLHGRRDADGWRFSRDLLDQTPLLIDEPMLNPESEIVHSWEEALGLLDRHPWHRFHPRTVHPEFRDKIWHEVQRRYEAVVGRSDGLLRWQKACLNSSCDNLSSTDP